jgi:hypothetical protein
MPRHDSLDALQPPAGEALEPLVDDVDRLAGTHADNVAHLIARTRLVNLLLADEGVDARLRDWALRADALQTAEAMREALRAAADEVGRDHMGEIAWGPGAPVLQEETVARLESAAGAMTDSLWSTARTLGRDFLAFAQEVQERLGLEPQAADWLARELGRIFVRALTGYATGTQIGERWWYEPATAQLAQDVPLPLGRAGEDPADVLERVRRLLEEFTVEPTRGHVAGPSWQDAIVAGVDCLFAKRWRGLSWDEVARIVWPQDHGTRRAELLGGKTDRRGHAKKAARRARALLTLPGPRGGEA